MNTPSNTAGMLLGAASTLFVLLAAVDSFVGNQVTVPAWCLLGDSVIGILALIQARQGRAGVGLALSAVSTAACGTALAYVSRSAGFHGFWRGQATGAAYLALALVRWQLPWTPEGTYQSTWWGIALVGLSVECFVAWGSFIAAHRSLVRSLREQNEALAREKQSAIAAAQIQVRLDIAREMHDVLAHRLSLISMHSAALEHLTTMTDHERIQAGALIRSNARASLSELRDILSDLRDDQPQAPQPGIVDLPQLAVDASTPVNPVQIDIESDVSGLAPSVGRHLFRITQEAITNAHKYGSPGRIHVRLRQEADHYLLSVTNPVTGRSSAPPGFGLQGITERVHLCGGNLTYAMQDSTYVLEVTIPMRENQ